MDNLIKKDDKIFIAGHKGMAGAAIRRSFIKKGYNNIVTVDRRKLDLTDYEKVKNWFKYNRPDIVVIAAAKVGGILANNTYPTEFLLENTKIQCNLIENAWQNDSKRLLFLGSSCIYPKNSAQPIKEESLLSGELEITNECYAIAKISGIKLCEALRNQYDFDAISLMPTNLYGPGDNYHKDNSHVIAALIDRIFQAKKENLSSINCWGSGRPRREFLFCDDLGDACVFALEKWNHKLKNAPLDNKGKPLAFLNVGSGTDLTIRELVSNICKVIDYKGTVEWDTSKPDGTMLKKLDCKRINKLGWRHKIDLVSGLEMTIKDYKKMEKSNLIKRR